MCLVNQSTPSWPDHPPKGILRASAATPPQSVRPSVLKTVTLEDGSFSARLFLVRSSLHRSPYFSLAKVCFGCQVLCKTAKISSTVTIMMTIVSIHWPMTLDPHSENSHREKVSQKIRSHLMKQHEIAVSPRCRSAELPTRPELRTHNTEDDAAQ